MQGQCYNGSLNMAGARNGCKEIVQKHAPMDTYTHCAAHLKLCLLAIFKSSKAPRHALGRLLDSLRTQLNENVC